MWAWNGMESIDPIAFLPFCFSKFYIHSLTNSSIRAHPHTCALKSVRIRVLLAPDFSQKASAIINAMAARNPIVHQCGLNRLPAAG